MTEQLGKFCTRRRLSIDLRDWELLPMVNASKFTDSYRFTPPKPPLFVMNFYPAVRCWPFVELFPLPRGAAGELTFQ